MDKNQTYVIEVIELAKLGNSYWIKNDFGEFCNIPDDIINNKILGDIKTIRKQKLEKIDAKSKTW